MIDAKEVIPKTLRIGPFDWKIEWIEKNYADQLRIGETDWADLKIKISAKEPNQRIAEVIIHEILHAVLHTTSIKELSRELEETVVTNMAYGLSSVIRDNPGLFAKIEALQIREE